MSLINIMGYAWAIGIGLIILILKTDGLTILHQKQRCPHCGNDNGELFVAGAIVIIASCTLIGFISYIFYSVVKHDHLRKSRS